MADDDWIDRTIHNLYEGFLHRAADPGGFSHFKERLQDGGTAQLPAIIDQILNSTEFSHSIARDFGSGTTLVDDFRFRVPQNFRLDRERRRKILIVGSCLMDNWQQTLCRHDPNLSIDRIVFNNASPLPARDDLESFDFQIVQIPLRAVVPEGLFFGLRFDDIEGWENAFRESKARLLRNIEAGIAYNRISSIRTYVLGFQIPQQNPVGRLQNRYALNNICFYIEQLNRLIHDSLLEYDDAYYVDFDQIISTYGKKYYQDDAIYHCVHGSQLGPATTQADDIRLEPVGDIREIYGPVHHKVIIATYEEALGADRSLLQTDSVKLVIFDLDDTLWRGVVAEQDDVDPVNNIEGWPLGVIEAVSNLWRRGVLVAIASKNDDARARSNWDKLYGKVFPMENFVAVKISWKPKTESIRDILQEVNILQDNVVFVDDNPVERQRVREAFPQMRLLGGSILEWRRILLWSAEVQRGIITGESANRTDMVKAQILRDSQSRSIGKDDFLLSINMQVSIDEIYHVSSSLFDRAFELINKTNQFNTTGQRWSRPELIDFLSSGGAMMCASVSDRFTNYGFVALAMMKDGIVYQFVMSCRVFGLGVENAVLGAIVAKYPDDVLRIRLVKTEKNGITRASLETMGFVDTGTFWEISRYAIPRPDHIEMA